MQRIVPKRRAVAIALGLFLATLTLVAPPVAAVEIGQPEFAPGSLTVRIRFEDPDVVPLTRVLLHFSCDGPGDASRDFTDVHELAEGNATDFATLHISPLSNATTGYGYIQGEQTGYGYDAFEGHGYATGDTSTGHGYGYGYGYLGGGELLLYFDLHAAAFLPNESCTVVVGIDTPGLAGDFESPRSPAFQPRIPPVADANPGPAVTFITKPERANVTLDGSESDDPDGLPDPLGYGWTQTTGQPVTITSGAEPWLANFTTPVVDGQEDFTFALNVSDGLDWNVDLVVFRVHHVNAPPVADAGEDQTVAEGDEVTLDGSFSFDPDLDPLEFLWEQVSGPTVLIEGADTDSPTFTAPDPGAGDGDAVFRLNVTDGAPGSDDEDLVTVRIQKLPLAQLEVPTTPTDKREGRAPHSVPFSVTAICYTPVPCEDAVLDFGDGEQTRDLAQTVTHVYEEAGVYEAVLYVLDARGLEATSTVVITVLDAGTPFAHAGPDQVVYAGASVTLDGRGSHDPDGLPLETYAWQRVSGPSVTLNTADPKRPTFTAPAAATELTFRLTVTDSEDLTDTDEVKVKVIALPGGSASETYFLHSPGCLLAGQAVVAGDELPVALGARDAHASHTGDGDAPLRLLEPAEAVGHLCAQPTDNVAGAVAALLGAAPVPAVPAASADPALFDGMSEFPAEDGTNHAYAPGSQVEGTIGLALLLPQGVADVPLDAATLDVFLVNGAGVPVGSQTGIPVGYDDLAFGVPGTLLAGEPTAPDPRVRHVAVGFGFTTQGGSIPQGSGFTLAIRVNSQLVNVYLEDGHGSGFTLEQAAPQQALRPIAVAAPVAPVTAGDDVGLDGAAEELADSDVQFEWYQVAGPHVDLGGATSDAPSFEAPAVGPAGETLRFALQVRDVRTPDGLTSAPAEVAVRVNPAGGDGGNGGENRRPVVSAGSDLVANEGAAVVLNGVVVDEDGEPFTAVWTQVSGDPVQLTPMPASDAAFVAPQVTADRVLAFRLAATDARGLSADDTVTVTVRNVASGSGSGGGSGSGSGGSGSGGDGSGSGSGSGSGGSSSSSSTSLTLPPTPTSTSSSSTSSLPGGVPDPVGGLLGYDLSASLRVTRVGTLNHLEWDSPGFQPLGYQLWASNSPYVLLAITEGNQTAYDDATGDEDTIYKVTYFTGLTQEEGFFGDASAVFAWPVNEDDGPARKTGIPSAGFGLLAVALVGAAVLLAARRRLP